MLDLLSMGRITSGYGKRTSPTAGASSNHKGIDIVLDSYNIPSVSDGVVEYVGYSSSGGNMIYIRNSDGYLAQYLHMKSESPLSVGDTVKEGQTIGIMGSTGVSTGDHLHFGVKNASGNHIDPEDYLSGATGTTVFGSVSSSSDSSSSDSSDGIKGALLNIAGKIVQFLVIVLIAVLAVYLFMKAFDISIL